MRHRGDEREASTSEVRPNDLDAASEAGNENDGITRVFQLLRGSQHLLLVTDHLGALRASDYASTPYFEGKGW
jgi:hypothetical protein